MQGHDFVISGFPPFVPGTGIRYTANGGLPGIQVRPVEDMDDWILFLSGSFVSLLSRRRLALAPESSGRGLGPGAVTQTGPPSGLYKSHP